MLVRTFLLIIVAFVLLPAVRAAEPESVSGEFRALVPRQMLPLLHAPEIHEELKFTATQIAELEALFTEIDGIWFRARIQSPEKQTPILDSLDGRVHQWLDDHVSNEQRERLSQIELQAQSVRMLLRDDLAQQLKLDSSQQKRFADLAKATAAAQSAFQKAALQGDAADALKSKAAAAAQAEHDAVKRVLKPEQQQRLSKLLGQPFDTTKVNRIYPMAPEFAPVEHWLNSEPLTLRELRGKVLLIHFYAFQCHNCHANFEIYRRWHAQLRGQGVVVVGIQTPETSLERDPATVTAAAAERKLDFPILIDVASKNWEAWGNTMWPTVYVVDKNGYIRHWWQGELNWKGATGDKTIEKIVQTLLAEPEPAK